MSIVGSSPGSWRLDPEIPVKNGEEFFVKPRTSGNGAIGTNEKRRTGTMITITLDHVFTHKGNRVGDFMMRKKDVRSVVEGICFMIREVILDTVIRDNKRRVFYNFPPIPLSLIILPD